MAYTESATMKLNKEGAMIKIILDYQDNFNSVLNDLKKHMAKRNSYLHKVETDLRDRKHFNKRLTGRIINLERQCYGNKHHLHKDLWYSQCSKKKVLKRLY